MSAGGRKGLFVETSEYPVDRLTDDWRNKKEYHNIIF
jgi:hypothetical protein